MAMDSQMHDIVHDSPSLHVDTTRLYHVVIDSMEQKAERLDHHQYSHQVVDLEHRISAGTGKGHCVSDLLVCLKTDWEGREL